jgi:hypothetical protein
MAHVQNQVRAAAALAQLLSEVEVQGGPGRQVELTGDLEDRDAGGAVGDGDGERCDHRKVECPGRVVDHGMDHGCDVSLVRLDQSARWSWSVRVWGAAGCISHEPSAAATPVASLAAHGL